MKATYFAINSQTNVVSPTLYSRKQDAYIAFADAVGLPPIAELGEELVKLSGATLIPVEVELPDHVQVYQPGSVLAELAEIAA